MSDRMTGSLPDYNEVMRRWPEELMDYLPTELMTKEEIIRRRLEGLDQFIENEIREMLWRYPLRMGTYALVDLDECIA